MTLPCQVSPFPLLASSLQPARHSTQQGLEAATAALQRVDLVQLPHHGPAQTPSPASGRSTAGLTPFTDSTPLFPSTGPVHVPLFPSTPRTPREPSQPSQQNQLHQCVQDDSLPSQHSQHSRSVSTRVSPGPRLFSPSLLDSVEPSPSTPKGVPKEWGYPQTPSSPTQPGRGELLVSDLEGSLEGPSASLAALGWQPLGAKASWTHAATPAPHRSSPSRRARGLSRAAHSLPRAGLGSGRASEGPAFLGQTAAFLGYDSRAQDEFALGARGWEGMRTALLLSTRVEGRSVCV